MIAAYRRWRHARLLDAENRLLWAMRGGGRNYGYPISRAAGLRSGRTYPALTRLEQKGLVTYDWEDVPVRPRRRYWLTKDGMAVVAVRQAVAEHSGGRP